jgi:hypothetical protein
MTRRKFIGMLISGGTAVVFGVCRLAKKVVPRKFVRAVPLDKYPGLVEPSDNINGQSKWSG